MQEGLPRGRRLGLRGGGGGDGGGVLSACADGFDQCVSWKKGGRLADDVLIHAAQLLKDYRAIRQVPVSMTLTTV